jgi:hypothetical protein
VQKCEPLLEVMSLPQVAPLAGVAFSIITQVLSDAITNSGKRRKWLI